MLKAGSGVAAEKLHQLAVTPGAYSVTRCIGTSKWHNVTSGSNRTFYTLQRQNGKKQCPAGWRQFIALREEAAPGN